MEDAVSGWFTFFDVCGKVSLSDSNCFPRVSLLRCNVGFIEIHSWIVVVCVFAMQEQKAGGGRSWRISANRVCKKKR